MSDDLESFIAQQKAKLAKERQGLAPTENGLASSSQVQR